MLAEKVNAIEDDGLCIGNDYIFQSFTPDHWNQLVTAQNLQYNDDHLYLGDFGHEDVLVSWTYFADAQKLTATIQGSGLPGCDFVILQIAEAVKAAQGTTA